MSWCPSQFQPRFPILGCRIVFMLTFNNVILEFYHTHYTHTHRHHTFYCIETGCRRTCLIRGSISAVLLNPLPAYSMKNYLGIEKKACHKQHTGRIVYTQNKQNLIYSMIFRHNRTQPTILSANFLSKRPIIR